MQDFFRQTGVKRLHPFMDLFGETTSALGVVGLPLTLLIDRQGRETARKLGPAVWDDPQIVELIRSRLATPVSAVSAVSQAWDRPTMPGQDVAAMAVDVALLLKE